MLKNISKLGVSLNANEQKQINGGTRVPFCTTGSCYSFQQANILVGNTQNGSPCGVIFNNGNVCRGTMNSGNCCIV